jgi:hypothetical protein
MRSWPTRSGGYNCWPATTPAGPSASPTLYWSWQTLAAARIGMMNDLFVAAEARGSGVAEGRLIAACVERRREYGATRLVWQTASDNHRAQALHARVGATRDERWLDTTCQSSPSDLAGAEALFPDGQGPARRLPPLGEEEWLCCASRPLVVPVGLAR